METERNEEIERMAGIEAGFLLRAVVAAAVVNGGLLAALWLLGGL